MEQKVSDYIAEFLVEHGITHGFTVTGGGAMLYGLDHMLSNRIGIDVYLAQDPVSCVVIGTGKALDMMDKFAALSDN
jgi:rod shape-determining protein MreB